MGRDGREEGWQTSEDNGANKKGKKEERVREIGDDENGE